MQINSGSYKSSLAEPGKYLEWTREKANCYVRLGSLNPENRGKKQIVQRSTYNSWNRAIKRKRFESIVIRWKVLGSFIKGFSNRKTEDTWKRKLKYL